MEYAIKLNKTASGEYSAECPDLGFCSSEEFETEDEAYKFMASAIPAVMYGHFRARQKSIPLPLTEGDDFKYIGIPVKVQAKVLLWNYMREHEIRTGELAKILGIAQPAASRLTDMSKDKASVDAVERALAAIGGRFSLAVEE